MKTDIDAEQIISGTLWEVSDISIPELFGLDCYIRISLVDQTCSKILQAGIIMTSYLTWQQSNVADFRYSFTFKSV